MTGSGATGTHTGRYDQLSAVPEISNVTLPQHEPHRAVRGPSVRGIRERQSRCLLGLCGLFQGHQGTRPCPTYHMEGPKVVAQVVDRVDPLGPSPSVASGARRRHIGRR